MICSFFTDHGEETEEESDEYSDDDIMLEIFGENRMKKTKKSKKTNTRKNKGSRDSTSECLQETEY